MRTLLGLALLFQTRARMGTPCRAGTPECKLVNAQKIIRQHADAARRAALEARDAAKMARATSVAREAASRALANLLNTPRHVAAARAALATLEVADREDDLRDSETADLDEIAPATRVRGTPSLDSARLSIASQDDFNF